ncbi:hypothetical protein NMY22_g9531 [Coprinellus aureogranulatus]|nr:hypothetical protein NMY22_g9531 [Coprinellus aureogranulatus]
MSDSNSSCATPTTGIFIGTLGKVLQQSPICCKGLRHGRKEQGNKREAQQQPWFQPRSVAVLIRSQKPEVDVVELFPHFLLHTPLATFEGSSTPQDIIYQAIDEGLTNVETTAMPKFTPDSELELLFNPELIPASVKAELPPDLHIRPLARTDYHRSHIKVLSVLTSAPDPGLAGYQATFDAQRSLANTYYTLVIINKENDQVVAVGCVFIERKFLRNLGKVGHIEDIAVSKDMQGKKLGLRVIQALTGISESVGCYKTILNCSDDNIPFYKKCGYEKKENEMAKYNPDPIDPSRASTPKL